MMFLVAVTVMCIMHMIAQTQGHGRLTEPPSRATMWRYGWDNPVDYDDAQSFCGGFQVQWNQNEGRCGICGDAFNESTPRTHEVNGIYANGIIVDSYTVGAIVNVQVEITVNHKGYFQFRMCSYAEDGEDVEVSQECLDRHLLEIAGDHPEGADPTKYLVGTENGFYDFQVKLPDDLICNHCLFQWTYTTANNWGPCEDGTSAVGCGPQETFRACADVAVFPASTATFDISDTEDDDDDVDVDECTSPKCSSVGRTELKTGSFERPHVVQPAHSNKAYDDADKHSDHSSNGEPGKAEYFRSSSISLNADNAKITNQQQLL